jgi:hypothetical protein
MAYSTLLNTAPPIPTTTGAYEDSLEQTPQDYNNIMQGYQSIANNSRVSPIFSNPIQASPIQYSENPDVKRSISDLSDLASNGGYSGADIANIRARGISPIRSIFATSQQDVARQRGLQGGYSPNFAAVTAKMARDESNNIAQQTTNINAQIAQSVAQNRLAAASPFASATSAEAGRQLDTSKYNSENQLQTDETNQQTKLDVDKTNAGLQQQNTDNKFKALQGENSLYGTTPALASTFGNQVLGGANISAENARAGLTRPAPYGGVSSGSIPGNSPMLQRSIYG